MSQHSVSANPLLEQSGLSTWGRTQQAVRPTELNVTKTGKGHGDRASRPPIPCGGVCERHKYGLRGPISQRFSSITQSSSQLTSNSVGHPDQANEPRMARTEEGPLSRSLNSSWFWKRTNSSYRIVRLRTVTRRDGSCPWWLILGYDDFSSPFRGPPGSPLDRVVMPTP